MDFYNPTVTELYRQVKHADELAGDNVYTARAGNPGQSDVVQLQIIMDGTRITQARFKAHGAMTTIAAAEYLCRQVEQQELTSVAPLDGQAIKAALDLPSHRFNSALLIAQAWQQLVQKAIT